MTVDLFLGLLFSFSMLSSLVTEGIKKLVSDKKNLSWNIVALVVSLIIGGGGCLIYYQLSSILITTNGVIYAILMGLATGLCSMVTYDKVKQAILQIMNKEN